VCVCSQYCRFHPFTLILVNTRYWTRDTVSAPKYSFCYETR